MLLETYMHRWIAVMVAALILLGTGIASADTKNRDEVLKQCRGKFKGKTPNPKELNSVLNEHKTWLGVYAGKISTPKAQADPRKANLCGAELDSAKLNDLNLSGADLSAANLNEANLIQTNLSGAYLRGAILTTVTFETTNLNGADLSYADLSDSAVVEGGNFQADLFGADMKGVVFEPKDIPDVEDIAFAKNLFSIVFWFFSRICGWFSVPATCQVYGIRQFAAFPHSENHTLFS